MDLLLALLLQAAQPTTPPATLPAAPAGEFEYEVGPEDILRVTVHGHADLSLAVVVQSDGTFVFPLIGRVKASDLTAAELEQKLKLLLSKGFIRDPQVTVVVHEYRSRTVHVVGEVARPGPYPLTRTSTLMDLLSRAGPLAAGAGAEVIVLRPALPVRGPSTPGEASTSAEGAPQAEVIRINLREIEAGRFDRNIELKPNDTVLVPAARKLFVTGEVRNPGAFAYSPGITVRQAISMAGGFTEDAATGRLRIVRSVAGRTKEIKVGIDDPIEPGDTVLVKQKLF